MTSISTTTLYYVAAVMIALCLAFFVLRWRSVQFRRWMDARMAEGDRRLEERRR